ncbi:MAG: hypothetical protein V2A63_04935 [Patescibacteria group bacterium]
MRQAEKEAGGESQKSKSYSQYTEKTTSESDEKKAARNLLANSKTLLTFTIIAILGVWVYFTAVLGESNYLLGKFGRENLTAELGRKTDLLQQVRTDTRDTQKFSKLLQIEKLADRVTQIDLESPILNYQRPEGEKVVAREGSTNVLIKTVNDNGEIVYLSEAEVVSLEKAKNTRIDATKSAIEEIITQAKSLEGVIKVDSAIEDQFNIIIAEIAAIDLSSERDFPSATLKSHFAAAQSAASEILKNVKSENLNNLVADIKKQSDLIDTTNLDSTSKQIIESIKKSLSQLSQQRPSTFETAYNEIRALDISKISDNDVYQKVIQIVGDPRTEKSDSDLMTAAIITRNLGRINTINKLRANRIAWSTVIEHAEKVIRLGSDLTRDTDGTPTDSTRDIDPDGKLVMLTSYAGRTKDGSVEIRGEAFGKDNYSSRTFSLLSDLIDAFEGSRYFKNVSGFSFSREENRDGGISSPLDFELNLQDPATSDERDFVPVKKTKPVESVGNTDATVTEETINPEDIKNIEFDFSKNNANANDSKATEENSATQSTTTSSSELTTVFGALDSTLN